jgi:hypothetical protein
VRGGDGRSRTSHRSAHRVATGRAPTRSSVSVEEGGRVERQCLRISGFRDRRPTTEPSPSTVRGARIERAHAGLSRRRLPSCLTSQSCTAKESSLAARPYQDRLRTHAAVRTEPGDRTLRTWRVKPRTSPAVLARRSSGPWIRTTMTSAKDSRPTIRRSQNDAQCPRAESSRVTRRSERRRQIPWRGPGVSGWSRTIASLVRSEAAGNSAGRDVAPRASIDLALRG